MDTYLPPKYSLNSFFVRHVAHPKRMKYISGLNNSKICAVNDVGYLNNLSPLAKGDFPPNTFNEELLKSDSSFKRKEKAVPPNGMWSTFGLIDNTDKWRSELNSLASSVGLLTQTDLEEYKKKKERDQMIKSLNKPHTGTAHSQLNTASKRLGTSSNRLNEPLLTGRRTSRYSRGGSKGALATGSRKFIVDQADREVWMLQVLCQILQTDNLSDVQAWLVSTSDQEKERVKQLIDQAMKGLEESGRIENAEQLPVQNAESSALADIENTLNKINLNKEVTRSNSVSYNRDKTKLPNILKVDDDSDALLKKKLETISESHKHNDGAETPVSTIFNINMSKNKKKLLPIENAVVKVETPRGANDYKIEKVKVTMLVKDEKSKSLQEINGDWTE